MEGFRALHSTTYSETRGPFHRGPGAISPSKGGHFTVLRGAISPWINPWIHRDLWKTAVPRTGAI